MYVGVGQSLYIKIPFKRHENSHGWVGAETDLQVTRQHKEKVNKISDKTGSEFGAKALAKLFAVAGVREKTNCLVDLVKWTQ